MQYAPEIEAALNNIASAGRPFKTLVDHTRNNKIPITFGDPGPNLRGSFLRQKQSNEKKGSISIIKASGRIVIDPEFKDPYNLESIITHELTHLLDEQTTSPISDMPTLSPRQIFFLNQIFEARACAMAFTYNLIKVRKELKSQNIVQSGLHKEHHHRFESPFAFAFARHPLDDGAETYPKYLKKFLDKELPLIHDHLYLPALRRKVALTKTRNKEEFVHKTLTDAERKTNHLYRKFAKVPGSSKRFYEIKQNGMIDYGLTSPFVALQKFKIKKHHHKDKVFDSIRQLHLRLTTAEMGHADFLGDFYDWMQREPELLKASPALAKVNKGR